MATDRAIVRYAAARRLAACATALLLANLVAACGPGASPGGKAATLCATDQQPCPIDAGTYTTAPFEPTFTFVIGDGWSSDRVFADGGQISKGEAAFIWASGVNAGMVGGAEVEIGPTVTDFIEHLERFEGFDLSVPTTDTSLGGVPATQIDVTANETEAPGIYFIKEDRMNLAPGEKARFFLLDKDDATVILILEAYREEGFDAFVVETEPLLESLVWE